MAAECWDGIPGESDYETILKSVEKAEALMDFIREHEEELQDTWQVYFQAMIQMKARGLPLQQTGSGNRKKRSP